MLVKIKYRTPFENNVFGGADFIKNWPKIETTGIEVQEIDDLFYVVEGGKVVNDSAFFTKEEMEYLTVVTNNVGLI